MARILAALFFVFLVKTLAIPGILVGLAKYQGDLRIFLVFVSFF